MSVYKNLFTDPNFPKELLNRGEWPAVHEDNLEPDKKEVFLKRKQAVDLYLDGDKTIKEICEMTRINHTDLYRLLKRCVLIDRNGRVLGYRALIPYFRIKTYSRNIEIDGFDIIDEELKLTGAFQKLLKNFPDLKTDIDNLVFKKKKNSPHEPVTRGKDLHKKFVKLCKKHGISPEDGDYPFNTIDFGQRAFYRYLCKLKLERPQITVKDYGKDAEMLLKNTGVGEKSNIVERPFERVEFDGHKLNVVVAIKYTTPEGDEIIDVIDRMWLLAIVDTATRVTLGYHIVLGKEYSAADVITCVRNAVMPWLPKNVTIPGLKIPEGGGFASNVIPETKFAVWDELLFDNALANIAKNVKSKLKKIIGCHVNTGPVGTPTRRPHIEKLFHVLEEEGFNRATSTTGNDHKDPRRKNAEKKAIQFEITPDEIVQLVEVLLATRNGTRQRGLNNLTPLETMQQRISRKMPFRLLSEEHRDGFEFLTIEDERVIRGKLKGGRRPYIQYEGVDYRGDVLSEAFNLISTKLKLIVNIEDLRYIKAYLPDGSELGLLKATGKWGIRKHSLKIRKAINKLQSRGELNILLEEDPIEVYHNYLKNKAKKNKNSRTTLASIEKFLDSETELTKNEKSSSTRTDCNKDEFEQKDPSNVHLISNKVSQKNNSSKREVKRKRYFFNS